MKVSIQAELAAGTLIEAKAEALIMKSLTVSSVPSLLNDSFKVFFNFKISSKSRSMVR